MIRSIHKPFALACKYTLRDRKIVLVGSIFILRIDASVKIFFLWSRNLFISKDNRLGLRLSNFCAGCCLDF